MDPSLPQNPPAPFSPPPLPKSPLSPPAHPPVASVIGGSPQNPVPPEIPSIRQPSPPPSPSGGGPGPSVASTAVGGPKKNKKLLAGIIGLIMLIFAIGAGVYFGVLRPQELRKEATREDYSDPCCDINGCYTFNNGCSLAHFTFPDYYVNRYHCPNGTGGDSCSDAQYLVETGVASATFHENCGIEQIDLFNTVGFSSKIYDNICYPPPESTPTPIPTPTPPVRPDYCVDASVNPTSLVPGQTTVFSSTSNTPVNYFSYALYNRDNEYNPGNPKPICVAQGGDINVQGDCPNGTHQLAFLYHSQTTVTTGSRTVSYEELFVPDQNNGGQTVSRIQMNAFFMLEGGQTSISNPACVAYVAAANTPTVTPPSVVAQCTSVSVQKLVGTVWQDITNPETDAQIGDQLRFLVTGSTNNGSFTKAAFFINHGSPIVDATPADGFSTEYTLTAGQLTVEAVLYHSTEGWVD